MTKRTPLLGRLGIATLFAAGIPWLSACGGLVAGPPEEPLAKERSYAARLVAGLATRVWPVGDSNVYGHGGTPNNEGWRRRLDDWVEARGWGAAWDFVGSSPAGSGFDADQNGHPALTIAKIDTVVTTQYLTGNVPPADLVLFLAGTNDCAISYDGDATPSAYAALLAKIHSVNLAGHIVVMTLPPHANAAANVADFNARLPAIWDAHDASHTSKLIRVDVFSALGGGWTVSFMADAAHPNNAGYDAWAKAIEDALTTQDL